MPDLVAVEVVALRLAGGPQDRQNVAEAKIVVALGGQLLLAQRVTDLELLGQVRELRVADGAKLDLGLTPPGSNRQTTSEVRQGSCAGTTTAGRGGSGRDERAKVQPLTLMMMS